MRLYIYSLRLIVLAVGASLLVFATAFAQEDVTTGAETSSEAATEGTSDQPPQNPLLQQGDAELNAGEFEKAMKTFEQMAVESQKQGGLEGMQNLALAQVGTARALAGLGEYEAALDALNNILGQDPEFAPALIARGLLNLELNSLEAYEEALADFEAVARQPGQRANPAVQFGLGKSNVLLQRFDQAVKPLSRVIATNPQNAEALRLRGTAYGWLFKTKEAVADLDESLKLNDKDHETYLNLGIVYLRNKDYQKAVDEFGKAIENYKPKPGQEDLPFTQGYLTRSAAYVELGKAAEDEASRKAAYQAALDEANKVLGQLDENNPYHAAARAAALQTRGIAERMLGELGPAIRSFSQVIEINPQPELLADAYFRRGICLHLIGEDKMAISDFSTSAHLSLNDPRASLWEGLSHAKAADYQEALRAYGNAIAASDRYTPAYVNRGLAHLALGDNEKAVADFNDAIRLEPTEAEHYVKRGIAYERLGENEKASQSFASAIEFDNKNVRAYRHMADVMQSLGRSELATEYRQKADELAASEKPKQ
jgi:tetratricopeptide (TPR) repeat protein